MVVDGAEFDAAAIVEDVAGGDHDVVNTTVCFVVGEEESEFAVGLDGEVVESQFFRIAGKDSYGSVVFYNAVIEDGVEEFVVQTDPSGLVVEHAAVGGKYTTAVVVGDSIKSIVLKFAV